jgi:hypothetical protein
VSHDGSRPTTRLPEGTGVEAGHGKTHRIWAARRGNPSPKVLGDGRLVGVDPELIKLLAPSL